MRSIVLALATIMVFIHCKQKQGAKSGTQKLTELAGAKDSSDQLKEGDIVFQTSLSSQSKAIQLATHSRYSHCGILYKNGNDFYVLEAIEPVTNTPLQEWINSGANHHFVVKRLQQDSLLTATAIAQMKSLGQQWLGKHYDLAFEWSDQKMYCSELVWKMYAEVLQLELSKKQALREFDFSHPIVQQKMKERYGSKIPFDEPVISPAALFESDFLRTVSTN
jgi:hypothetical protein